jgi:hypothetical protein
VTKDCICPVQLMHIFMTMICVCCLYNQVLGFNHYIEYRIFRPIARASSTQNRSEIVKNEHVRYTLERFPTDNARVICTKIDVGKYGIMY